MVINDLYVNEVSNICDNQVKGEGGEYSYARFWDASTLADFSIKPNRIIYSNEKWL